MAKTPVDLAQVLLHLKAVLALHGALPAAEYRAAKKHISALTPQLRSSGYEVTPRQVRVPLAAQIEKLTAFSVVLLKGLEKRLAGATAAEVKVTVQAMLVSGTLLSVLRPSGASIALATSVQQHAKFIDPSETAALLRELSAAQRLVRSAHSKKAARPLLLKDDVMAALIRFVAPATNAVVDVPPQRSLFSPVAADPAEVDAVLIQLRQRLTHAVFPVRLPELLRAVCTSSALAKSAVLQGAAAGMFALEPESGMGRLSAEDAAWCPAGPGGTLLSWLHAGQQPELP